MSPAPSWVLEHPREQGACAGPWRENAGEPNFRKRRACFLLVYGKMLRGHLAGDRAPVALLGCPWPLGVRSSLWSASVSIFSLR